MNKKYFEFEFLKKFSKVYSFNDIKDYFIFKTEFTSINLITDDFVNMIHSHLEKMNINYAIYYNYGYDMKIYTSKIFQIDKVWCKIKYNIDVSEPVKDSFPFCLRIGK